MDKVNKLECSVQVVDPKEKRRQRARELYAQLSDEKKKERNKRDRERYANKTAKQKEEKRQKCSKTVMNEQTEVITKDQEHDENINCISDPLQKCFDIEMIENIEVAAEDHQHGKINCLSYPTQECSELEMVAKGKKRSHDVLQRGNIIDLTVDKRKIKCMREKRRYANLTDAEKKARCRRSTIQNSQRRHSLNPDDVEKKLESRRKKHKVKRHLQSITLNKESIALENPMYTPENVSSPHDVETFDSWDSNVIDLIVPRVFGRPIYLAPSQNSAELKSIKISHNKHVPNGGRHALLHHRNKIFETATAKKIVDSKLDISTSESKDANGVATMTESVIINNESVNDDVIASSTAMSTCSQVDNNDEEEGVVFEDDSDEEEDFIFDQQDEEINSFTDVEEEYDDTTPIPVDLDPYDVIYSNLAETNTLKPQDNCSFCNAKRFQYEPKGFCCREGKITLSDPETPPELMRLWTSADADARHFRDNIRFFNGHFSFTSLYCKLDSDTTNLNKHPIYTFRAHGQMYHNIRSFGKQDGLEPNHLELYFYDDDPSLDHRYRKCRKDLEELDKEVFSRIVNILKGNPYSEQLRNMGGVENIEDYCISLNLDQRLDQRTYNAPISSEVAAVWIEGNERRKNFESSVVLQGKNRKIYGIQSYHGCYDPLSYPLFFPKGELGWHTDIPRNNVNYEKLVARRAAHKARGEGVDNNDEDDADGDDSGNGASALCSHL